MRDLTSPSPSPSHHSYQINTAKGILDTILSIQPKEGSSMGGETREAVVNRLCLDMLNKLPADYVSFEVRFAGAGEGRTNGQGWQLRQGNICGQISDIT